MVAALKGTAANMLAGMTATQMDNYDCLIERLHNRYDPSERESIYHTQLSTQTGHHSECPDEFAEAITLLAQKHHPTHEVGIAEDDQHHGQVLCGSVRPGTGQTFILVPKSGTL